MDNLRQRKEPVTIRLDINIKKKLQALAEKGDLTVSALIDLAVQEFIDRQAGIGVALETKLKIRHAGLPDTSVLRAFSSCAKKDCDRIVHDLNLPSLEFVKERTEWRRLPADLFSGESDLVESVNWSPIFWHVKLGGSTPRLDWIGPFLQLFVGHCVFVRLDFLRNYFSKTELDNFEAYRGKGTGRDRSLRSLVAWARSLLSNSSMRENLEKMWSDAVVGCQIGTDYHIAVRRVTPILGNSTQEPAISGIDSLDQGFQEFCNGTITAFTGSLVQSAELLTSRNNMAFLLAGPADLRVPSLNTLAGRKGMLHNLLFTTSVCRLPTLPPLIAAVLDKALQEIEVPVDEVEMREKLQRLRYPDAGAFRVALANAFRYSNVVA